MTDQVTVSRELLRKVLDALKAHSHPRFLPDDFAEAITALREALEQPVQEPLTVHQIRLSDATWVNCCETTFDYHNRMGWKTRVLETYAAPQARTSTDVQQQRSQWLTEEELDGIVRSNEGPCGADFGSVARAIERAVLRKNGMVK